mmetsp:Transcript_52048/g.166742  ORF Transcript_52048/g.166742 Transcript_52048/m.166742 type:complete len:284 (-) Transcript_52048:674-1525(-)
MINLDTRCWPMRCRRAGLLGSCATAGFCAGLAAAGPPNRAHSGNGCCLRAQSRECGCLTRGAKLAEGRAIVSHDKRTEAHMHCCQSLRGRGQSSAEDGAQAPPVPVGLLKVNVALPEGPGAPIEAHRLHGPLQQRTDLGLRAAALGRRRTGRVAEVDPEVHAGRSHGHGIRVSLQRRLVAVFPPLDIREALPIAPTEGKLSKERGVDSPEVAREAGALREGDEPHPHVECAGLLQHRCLQGRHLRRGQRPCNEGRAGPLHARTPGIVAPGRAGSLRRVTAGGA